MPTGSTRSKTWKGSTDPEFAAKKARIERLYAVADGEVEPREGEPEVVICLDEFGPLNLQPRPGRQWTAINGPTLLRPRRHRPTNPPGTGQHDRCHIIWRNRHIEDRRLRRIVDRANVA
jgi:hypothetical protein